MVGIGFLSTDAKAASKAMRFWQAAHSQGPTRLADLHLGVLEVQLSSPVAHLSLCSVGQHPEPTDWGQASAA
jgi:hypothetical protein